VTPTRRTFATPLAVAPSTRPTPANAPTLVAAGSTHVVSSASLPLAVVSSSPLPPRLKNSSPWVTTARPTSIKSKRLALRPIVHLRKLPHQTSKTLPPGPGSPKQMRTAEEHHVDVRAAFNCHKPVLFVIPKAPKPPPGPPDQRPAL
jgi:hypothetical protein